MQTQVYVYQGYNNGLKYSSDNQKGQPETLPVCQGHKHDNEYIRSFLIYIYYLWTVCINDLN